MNIVQGIGYAVAHPIKAVANFLNWIVDMVSGGERRTDLACEEKRGVALDSREVATSSREGRDIEDPEVFATTEELVSSRTEEDVLLQIFDADLGNLRSGIDEYVLNPEDGEKSKSFWKAHNAVWKIVLERERFISEELEFGDTLQDCEKESGDLDALRKDMFKALEGREELPSMAGLNDVQLMDVGITALAMLEGAKYENFYLGCDDLLNMVPEVMHAARVFKEVIRLSPEMKEELVLRAQPIARALEALLDGESDQLNNQIAFALNTFFDTAYPYRRTLTDSDEEGESVVDFEIDSDCDDNDK